MKTIIKNGECIFEKKMETTDIEITGDVITSIEKNITPEPGATVIDAKGKYVFPGIVDFNAHFSDALGLFLCSDTYTSGTEAAILNGVTTINGFINQNYSQSLTQAITGEIEKAKGNIYSDLRWHLTPTRFSDVNYTDIAKWIEKGFNSFKFYTTFKQANLYMQYDKILEIAKRLDKFEPTFIVHCEDEAILNSTKYLQFDMSSPYTLNQIRSEEAELTATEKVIDICRNSQIDFVIANVSSADALGQIELAKRDCPIVCEAVPQYTFLSEHAYRDGDGYYYICIPPLRGEECRSLFVKKMMLNYADIFASYHRAFSADLKSKSRNDLRNVPAGIPALGAMFHLFVDLIINKSDADIPTYYKKLSTNPARMAGIYPRKGTLSVGSDADILVVNPDGVERPIYGSLSNAHNPWGNRKTKFSMDYVFLRGDVVVKDNALVNKANMTGKILCEE